MTKKTSKQPENTIEAATELAIGALTTSLRIINGELERIERGGPVVGESEVTRVALLGPKAAAIWAELRKTAKGEELKLADLSLEQVVQWAKLQTPERRQRLAQTVIAIDDKNRRSVLG